MLVMRSRQVHKESKNQYGNKQSPSPEEVTGSESILVYDLLLPLAQLPVVSGELHEQENNSCH